jgi:RNA polymerase sigma-70 factor, ECF subfamily
VDARTEPLEVSGGPDAAVDREARFAAFVDAHRERSVRLAWRMLGDQSAAEDVAQDAFVRAYRALPRFREEAELSTWFHQILVRQVHNHRRWAAVRRRWASWVGTDPVSRPVPRDGGLPKRLNQALDALTANQREAFVLVHLEGFTIREAAEVAGRAPGTMKSHLHRALVSLRASLADVYAEELA